MSVCHAYQWIEDSTNRPIEIPVRAGPCERWTSVPPAPTEDPRVFASSVNSEATLEVFDQHLQSTLFANSEVSILEPNMSPATYTNLAPCSNEWIVIDNIGYVDCIFNIVNSGGWEPSQYVGFWTILLSYIVWKQTWNTVTAPWTLASI